MDSRFWSLQFPVPHLRCQKHWSSLKQFPSSIPHWLPLSVEQHVHVSAFEVPVQSHPIEISIKNIYLKFCKSRRQIYFHCLFEYWNNTWYVLDYFLTKETKKNIFFYGKNPIDKVKFGYFKQLQIKNKSFGYIFSGNLNMLSIKQ